MDLVRTIIIDLKFTIDLPFILQLSEARLPYKKLLLIMNF